MGTIELASRVLDFGLNTFATECDKILVCSAGTITDYSGAVAAALGEKDFGTDPAFGSPYDSATKGRVIASAEILDGTVYSAGTVEQWAAVDSGNSRLLAIGEISSPNVVDSGKVFTLGQIYVHTNNQPPVPEKLFRSMQTGYGSTVKYADFSVNVPANAHYVLCGIACNSVISSAQISTNYFTVVHSYVIPVWTGYISYFIIDTSVCGTGDLVVRVTVTTNYIYIHCAAWTLRNLVSSAAKDTADAQDSGSIQGWWNNVPGPSVNTQDLVFAMSYLQLAHATMSTFTCTDETVENSIVSPTVNKSLAGYFTAANDHDPTNIGLYFGTGTTGKAMSLVSLA